MSEQDFDLEKYIQEEVKGIDDSAWKNGCENGLKAGFVKALELIEAGVNANFFISRAENKGTFYAVDSDALLAEIKRLRGN